MWRSTLENVFIVGLHRNTQIPKNMSCTTSKIAYMMTMAKGNQIKVILLLGNFVWEVWIASSMDSQLQTKSHYNVSIITKEL